MFNYPKIGEINSPDVFDQIVRDLLETSKEPPDREKVLTVLKNQIFVGKQISAHFQSTYLKDEKLELTSSSSSPQKIKQQSEKKRSPQNLSLEKPGSGKKRKLNLSKSKSKNKRETPSRKKKSTDLPNTNFSSPINYQPPKKSGKESGEKTKEPTSSPRDSSG